MRTAMSHEHRPDQLSVYCPHCEAHFFAAKSMRGGYANCPTCQRAVQVAGGYEPLFWVLFSLGAAFVLFFSWMLFLGAGPIAGGVAFLIGAAALTIIVLAS